MKFTKLGWQSQLKAFNKNKAFSIELAIIT